MQGACASNVVYKPGMSDLLGDYSYNDLDTLVSELEFDEEMQGTMIEMEDEDICKEILEENNEDKTNDEESGQNQNLTTLDPGYINKYLSHIEESGNSGSQPSSQEFRDIKSDITNSTGIDMENREDDYKTNQQQNKFLGSYVVSTETKTEDNTEDKEMETIVCEPCTITVSTSNNSHETIPHIRCNDTV